jgi:hypothetical protein
LANEKNHLVRSISLWVLINGFFFLYLLDF